MEAFARLDLADGEDAALGVRRTPFGTGAPSDEQVGDITAFLAVLTGPFPQQTMPRLPPTPGDMLE